MQHAGHPRHGLLRARVALVLLLGILGIALAFTGIGQGHPSAETEAIESPEPWVAGRQLYSVTLPYEEPRVPPGPNREQFTALCRLCHSPRLALTQPRFTEKKWGEVVHKMVTVYGAPILSQQEQEIVAYLTWVRGPEQRK